jgi:hypothetical protein
MCVEDIVSNGWLQGSVCSSDLVEPDNTDPAPDLWIVASHSCDVRTPDLAKEPRVDLIPARRIPATSGTFLNGRNPRKMHVVFEDQAIELDLPRKVTIDRSILARTKPLGILDHKHADILRTWLGARYARSAFPDAFNARLRQAGTDADLRASFEGCGDWLESVYVETEDVELPPSENYRVRLVLAMRPENYEDSSRRRAVEACALTVAESLEGCDGVELMDVETVSESRLTVTELRALRRFDYDYLTFRDSGADEDPSPRF